MVLVVDLVICCPCETFVHNYVVKVEHLAIRGVLVVELIICCPGGTTDNKWCRWNTWSYVVLVEHLVICWPGGTLDYTWCCWILRNMLY